MSTTLDRAFPVAVKAHRCGSCDGPITAGEQYHRWKGTTDYTEGVVTLKECRECFERYVNHRAWLNDENCAKAEAWLGYSLPSRETEQPICRCGRDRESCHDCYSDAPKETP